MTPLNPEKAKLFIDVHPYKILENRPFYEGFLVRLRGV